MSINGTHDDVDVDEDDDNHDDDDTSSWCFRWRRGFSSICLVGNT